jgi:ribosomal-protein-alanine N-acetyltransferase
VAADNIAAQQLYRGCGFVENGRRRGYYRRRGIAVDALILRRTLPA